MSVTTPTASAAFEETAPGSVGSMQGSPGRHRRSLRGRIVSGLLSHGGWSLVVATTGISGLNFLFHVLISRLLGPSQYGAFNAVLNVISVLAVPLGAVQLAVTHAVVSGAGKERISLRRLTVKAMLWGTGAMVAVGLASPLIDGFLNLKSPSASLATAVWIPLAVVAAVLQGALLGELRFVPVAVASFIGGGALRLATGALLVSAGFGLVGAVAATVIGQAFTTAALLLVARREVFARGLDSIRISLRDAVLSIAALAGYTTLTGIDVFLARHFLAPVASGLYAAAATAGHIAMFLPGALVVVAYPRLISAGRTGISVGKTLTETVGLVTAIGLAAFAVLAVMPGVVVDVLFGRKYSAAASIVGIIGLTSVFLGIIGVLTYFHVARRSVAALYSWAGVALVWVLVAALHGGMKTIAVCMLVASGSVLVAVSFPALAAVVRPVSRAAPPSDGAVELPPAEIDLSLVIPFYNPGSRLASHVEAVIDVLRAEQVTFEVIAVSDGSTDGSPSSIAGIGQVRIVELVKNQGKGAALRVGLAQGRGRYLGFIDCDGDIPARQLSHFLAAVRTGDPDVVLGAKSHPDSDVVYPPLRRLYSFGYQQLTRLLFWLPTRDTQTGIKLIRRETLAAVLPKMLEKRFAFDLELLVVARRMGYRNCVELPVQIAERFTSTISPKAVWRTFLDTLAIFYRLRVVHFYGPQLALASGPSQVSLSASRSWSRADALSLTATALAPGRGQVSRSDCRSWSRADAPSLTATALSGSGPAGGPLRILAYNWRDLAHPRAGGAEVYLQSVAREWVRRGHQVTVFCGAVAGRPAEEFVDGVRILRRGSRIGVYREAGRYWRREGDGQYDLVVDCVNTRPFFCSRFVRNVPVVAVIHQVAREVWRYETPWPISVIGRYLLEPAWLRAYRNVPVVTVSESSRESLAEYGLRRVTVVPEGWVPTRAVPFRKESVPTVVFLGRLSANKRPEHAIRAFGLARRQLPEAQMWVIGGGPEEARLRKMAGPGVTFLGRVSGEEKRERLGRAHALVATSVREGWGLVVTEAAASGTVAIGYDVAGLRDSIGASGGILTRADPASLATGLVRLLPSVAGGYGPRATPAGVVPWTEVAADILTVARKSESATIHVLDQVGSFAGDRAAGGRQGLSRVRAGLAVLGVALLLLGGIRDNLSLSPILVGAAFLALLAATLLGGVEGWLTRGGHHSQLRAEKRPTARGAGTWPSRIGPAIAGLTAAVAAQTWFYPGRLLAGGDVAPVVGTAWLGRLFAPWSWSGSNLGGPAADETKVPVAAVYWLVDALHGSPALAEDIWYTVLFVGAAVASYLFLRALRVGPAGSTIGALAYIFNAHIVTIGTNPVFLAAMVLLPGLPAVVLTTASGGWALRRGVLLLGASAPLLGYVSQNSPLLFMIAALLASMPLLVGWLDGWAAARRALLTLALGAPLLALASSYWLVPTVLQLKIDAVSTLANQSSWIWTEGRATLANGFWLNNDWGWKYAEYYPYAGDYDKLPLLILKFLLPITAFSFLALARFPRAIRMTGRQSRLGIAGSATALFVILLSTGTHLPGALVFDPLYRLPLGWQLREPGRFLILGGLGYSVLLALATEAARERLNSLPGTVRRWRSALQRPGLRLAVVGAASAAVLAPGFPLMTGAIAPNHRPVLPSVHVSVPSYWTSMASYLNRSEPPGNLLVLPEDDFYQMPYTWGYYGADTFITNLIARNVVDPQAQGYTPAPQELTDAVGLVQQGLLAHDWPSVQRTLAAIGTPLLLVRGDVNAAFPNRHITPPAALEKALSEDKNMRLIHRFGELELFALRNSISPAGPVTSYATVNSATPDLRDLALFPSGTALISSPMRSAVPAALQFPSVSQWQLVGDELQTSIVEPPGWQYSTRLLSATGAFEQQGVSSTPRARLITRVGHSDGQVVEELSYKLGGSLLSDGDFVSGTWGAVQNCAAFPGTAATAGLAARVLPGQGSAGLPALALSAKADSACEMRSLAWRSGPLFVSLWVRNISGAPPRMCLWEMPIDKCAAMSPLPSNPAPSHWYHYQAIVTPDQGTSSLALYLYADVFTPGTLTTDDYSDVVIRRSPVLLQPVVAATPQEHERPTPALYTVSDSFSPGWIGPTGASRVEVDGLRNGWLGTHPNDDPPHFGLSSLYLLSRFASLLAATLLLALALSLWPGRRYRPIASVRAALRGRERG
jgi:glycosyltransferase involved in cell wall biosynthesis/O-antigen/teichoic acid export membrane protein